MGALKVLDYIPEMKDFAADCSDDGADKTEFLIIFCMCHFTKITEQSISVLSSSLHHPPLPPQSLACRLTWAGEEDLQPNSCCDSSSIK